MQIRKASNLLWTLGFLITASGPVRAVKDSHTPEDVTLSKGFQAYMDGRDKEALSCFEEVIRVNPRNTAAQKGLSKVKTRLKKQTSIEQSKALNLSKAKVKEGRELMKTGDIVAAIDSFHDATDSTPNYKPAMSELKSIKDRMNKEVSKKRLNLSSWAFARGVVAYLDRDWAKAYRIWSERSRIEPKNVPLANATARAENKFKLVMQSEREEFFRRGGRAFYDQGLYKDAKHSWEQVLVLKPDDQEGLEGKARAEDAILRAEGTGRDSRLEDLLEQGLAYYSTQNWGKALGVFTEISQMDPQFSTAKEYIAKINDKLASSEYKPGYTGTSSGWKPAQVVTADENRVEMPQDLENFDQRVNQLKSQLKRDPTNIRAQQELDKLVKQQEEESERIYKDGLIAYSQGNRAMAIQQWKQVLIIYPEHKKAFAALKKARAEEERSDDTGGK